MLNLQDAFLLCPRRSEISVTLSNNGHVTPDNDAFGDV